GGGASKEAPPPSPCFLDMVETISLAVPKIRLRIGSLDPSVLSFEFCEKLAKIPRLCNHFHISLQSGCDETLFRMGRKYKTAQVEAAIASLRENFADCAITADLITGFPGETDKEFQETLSFIKKAKFSDMHIFPFSPRPGTKAAGMPCQVDKAVSKERARLAAEIAAQNANDFKVSQIGKIAEVLFEQQKKGYSIGHTTNYIEVAVKGAIKCNTIHKIQLTGIKADGAVTGKVHVKLFCRKKI
ncbi:MAG: radical SAM protein, partial [Oscillospiraceae bacterium]|nr:radical SAM protein [Oscillospiraceae bacterium]